MRNLGWVLAVGAGFVGSCAIPSTLGLPCVVHAHCDLGQHCGPDMMCVSGRPPPMMDGSTGISQVSPPDDDTSSDTISDDTLVVDGTGSSTGETSTSTSTSTSSSSSSSTGDACGEAVGSCDAVDMLFVIDNSGSMGDDNAQLIPAFGNVKQLVGPLIDGLCSYHIGVTTTETAPDFQPAECQVRGAMSRAGAICPDPFGDPDHPPWVSEEDNISTLGCLLAVGSNYDTDEKQLETTIESLSPELQGPDGCNEGFMREGVPLIVVLITDEDDDDDSGEPDEASSRTGSEGGPGTWFDDLTALKPANELAFVVLASTESAGCDWEPASGNSDGTGAEYAERILTFLQYFTGAGYADHFYAVNLCQPADDIVTEISALDELLFNVCDDV